MGELTRVLETIAEKRESLAGDEAFSEALGRAPSEGKLFAFVDVRKQEPFGLSLDLLQ